MKTWDVLLRGRDWVRERRVHATNWAIAIRRAANECRVEGWAFGEIHVWVREVERR